MAHATLVNRLASQMIEARPPLLEDADDHLLTAIARRLGEMWLEDSCTYCDVTLGVHRLARHHASREAARPAMVADGLLASAPTVLLSAVPSDQHGFGVALVGSALSQRGWLVTADVAPSAAALLAAVRGQRFDLIGLSVGHERAIEPTAGLVAALRRASRNRDVLVALGGPMLNERPALAKALGADLHAEDADGLDLACRGALPMAA